MSHGTIVYLKDLFEMVLFMFLVPLILWHVIKHRGKGIGAAVLEQGAVIP